MRRYKTAHSNIVEPSFDQRARGTGEIFISTAKILSACIIDLHYVETALYHSLIILGTSV